MKGEPLESYYFFKALFLKVLGVFQFKVTLISRHKIVQVFVLLDNN